MKKYEGKTLLMLGSNVGAKEMVLYARDNGAYTIVADYYDNDRSNAKPVADEGVCISTSDLDALSQLISERRVDGVLAGVSEFNLLNAMELSRENGLPFYCTKEQWDSIESKDRFRKLCVKYGVPCPKTIYSGIVEDANKVGEAIEGIEYPVVLKPVDCSSSQGVHICHSASELLYYLADSLHVSESKRIIIEQFVRGTEFTAHYTICEGKASLTCMDNRYPVSVHEGDVTTVPVARIYPCLFLDRYLECVNPQLLALCEGIGMRDGVLFIQGLYDKESDSFSIFEAGLRSAGEAPCRFTEKVNGINYFQVLVDHALLGESDYELKKDDPTLKGRCCGVVSFVARGATVGRIEGLEESVNAVPSVIAFESRYPVGSKTPDGDTLRQLMIRFVMDCDSRQQMADDIAYLNNHIVVEDSYGKDMVIRMEPNRVFGVL